MTYFPKVDRLDGLTATYGHNSWFNLCPSNVDPVLRLTIEAPDWTAVDRLHNQIRRLLPGTGR